MLRFLERVKKEDEVRRKLVQRFCVHIMWDLYKEYEYSRRDDKTCLTPYGTKHTSGTLFFSLGASSKTILNLLDTLLGQELALLQCIKPIF